MRRLLGSATARRRAVGLVLLPLIVTTTAAGIPRAYQEAPETAGGTAAGTYLGRWNHDRPDRTTMTNIATSDAPGRSQVPQIRDIVFTAEGADGIVGRTDVGCTWRFKATRDSLELDPPHQLCHNPTSAPRSAPRRTAHRRSSGHQNEGT